MFHNMDQDLRKVFTERSESIPFTLYCSKQMLDIKFSIYCIICIFQVLKESTYCLKAMI
jgi:hypothetical protein